MYTLCNHETHMLNEIQGRGWIMKASKVEVEWKKIDLIFFWYIDWIIYNLSFFHNFRLEQVEALVVSAVDRKLRHKLKASILVGEEEDLVVLDFMAEVDQVSMEVEEVEVIKCLIDQLVI